MYEEEDEELIGDETMEYEEDDKSDANSASVCSLCCKLTQDSSPNASFCVNEKIDIELYLSTIHNFSFKNTEIELCQICIEVVKIHLECKKKIAKFNKFTKEVNILSARKKKLQKMETELELNQKALHSTCEIKLKKVNLDSHDFTKSQPRKLSQGNEITNLKMKLFALKTNKKKLVSKVANLEKQLKNKPTVRSCLKTSVITMTEECHENDKSTGYLQVDELLLNISILADKFPPNEDNETVNQIRTDINQFKAKVSNFLDNKTEELKKLGEMSQEIQYLRKENIKWGNMVKSKETNLIEQTSNLSSIYNEKEEVNNTLAKQMKEMQQMDEKIKSITEKYALKINEYEAKLIQAYDQINKKSELINEQNEKMSQLIANQFGVNANEKTKMVWKFDATEEAIKLRENNQKLQIFNKKMHNELQGLKEENKKLLDQSNVKNAKFAQAYESINRQLKKQQIEFQQKLAEARDSTESDKGNEVKKLHFQLNELFSKKMKETQQMDEKLKSMTEKYALKINDYEAKLIQAYDQINKKSEEAIKLRENNQKLQIFNKKMHNELQGLKEENKKLLDQSNVKNAKFAQVYESINRQFNKQQIEFQQKFSEYDKTLALLQEKEKELGELRTTIKILTGLKTTSNPTQTSTITVENNTPQSLTSPLEQPQIKLMLMASKQQYFMESKQQYFMALTSQLKSQPTIVSNKVSVKTNILFPPSNQEKYSTMLSKCSTREQLWIKEIYFGLYDALMGYKIEHPNQVNIKEFRETYELLLKDVNQVAKSALCSPNLLTMTLNLVFMEVFKKLPDGIIPTDTSDESDESPLVIDFNLK